MTKKRQKKIKKIELNRQFKQALEKINRTTGPLYITGKAGTGKSTLLQYFRSNTEKQVAVVAPTGVAALNVGGQTIHSFFGFSPDVTPIEIRRGRKDGKIKQLLTNMQVLVIDEVSMVRADLMDCIDEACRYYLGNELPFGGKPVIFFGDLYQLPPVVTNAEEQQIFTTIYKSPYFFDAKVFTFIKIDIIELKKIYRQSDKNFIKILNSIRHNTISDAELAVLNKCCQPESFDSDEGYITLTTTNQSASEKNLIKLNRLPGQPKKYAGVVAGNFSQRNLPTETELLVKTGAQVMLLNNDPAGRWVNGSMGQIEEIVSDGQTGTDHLLIRLYGGELVEVGLFTWSVTRYFYNQLSRSIDTDTIGTFTQYPLRLAWAVTIHKSQGKTFDRVVLDLGRGAFSPGQVYVAVSRCTSLNGLVLTRPMIKRNIWTDTRIVDFMANYEKNRAIEILTLGKKIARLQQAISINEILTIVFLQSNNSEEKLTIRPMLVGEIGPRERKFIGVEYQEPGSRNKHQLRIDRIIRFE